MYAVYSVCVGGTDANFAVVWGFYGDHQGLVVLRPVLSLSSTVRCGLHALDQAGFVGS